MRFKPVFTLSLVEHHLQGSQAQSDEAEPYIVDAGFTQLAALEIRWILNQPRGQQDGQNPDGNVDEKYPTPAEVVGDPSPKSGTDRGRSNHSHSINGECHAALSRRKGVGKNRLLAGLQST